MICLKLENLHFQLNNDWISTKEVEYNNILQIPFVCATKTDKFTKSIDII
jgi:hypothetical protein